MDDGLKILFLAADPSDAARLRLGEELHDIQERLQLARLRDRIQLHQRLSVRPVDISQAILDLSPSIVHFSGHATSSGALLVQDREGLHHPISPQSLSNFFGSFVGQVKCVVLNACYSEVQAQAIVQYIDYVIGMSNRISDQASIAFSVGFYQALGAGKSIEEAFDLGRSLVGLENLQDQAGPVLLRKQISPPGISDIAIPAQLESIEKFIADKITYSPHLLPEWEAGINAGYWQAKFDCSDEILLSDLGAVLEEVLKKQAIASRSITDAGVGLVELCRNVARHAKSSVGAVEIAASFKHRRLVMNVSSLGEPFSLGDALSRYDVEPPEQHRVHGIENLLNRGEILVSSKNGVNTVRFAIRLPDQSSQEFSFLPLRLLPRSIVIGSQELPYRTWCYQLFGGIPSIASQIAASHVDFEPQKQILIRQWPGEPPVVIRVTNEPPDWTLNELEMATIYAFSSLVTSLKEDGRFLVSA